MADVYEELTVANAPGWSRWLGKHGADSPGVWLVLAKKGVTQPTSLTYDQALEEAICHGWVDGQLAKGDERTFRRKFTPRRPGSAWSKRNVALASRLTDAGRMKPAGLGAVQRAKVDGSWDALMRAKVRSPTPAGWHGFGGRTDRDGPNTNRTDLEDPSASLQNSSARGYPSGWSSGRDFGARSSLGGPRAAIHPYFRVRSAASWPSCTVRLMSDAAAVEYVISGLVVMRHHDRHPAMHHHGLGKLQLTERTLRLLIEPDDREVAAGDYSQVTIGSSLTSEEFGSILFLDFPSSQWTVDFATVQRQDIFRRADGSLDREKLFEYQVHLSVEDFEAGIDARKQFVELAAAGGVQVEDDSDLFERMLAKWRSREVRWDDDLGWPEGGAK